MARWAKSLLPWAAVSCGDAGSKQTKRVAVGEDSRESFTRHTAPPRAPPDPPRPSAPTGGLSPGPSEAGREPCAHVARWRPWAVQAPCRSRAPGKRSCPRITRNERDWSEQRVGFEPSMWKITSLQRALQGVLKLESILDSTARLSLDSPHARGHVGRVAGGHRVAEGPCWHSEVL